MKHTPGPWLDHHWQNWGSYIAIGPPDRYGDPATDMVRVYPRYRRMPGHEGALVTSEAVDEAGANARLIAAAPELLKACLNALGALRNLEFINILEIEAIDMLNAAIAKASGYREGLWIGSQS